MLAKILDFAPALAFFITYRMSSDLVLATGVIIACCLVSFALQYLVLHKVSRMQIFLTGAVVIFGIPTILLKDPEIIKLKVTVVNYVLALAILVFQNFLHKNPFSYLFGRELPLPDHIWSKLGTAFMLFFVFAGTLNLVIAFFLPTLLGIDSKNAESLWVDYKTFGTIILNTVFAFSLIFIMMRRYPEMMEAFKSISSGKDSSASSTNDASNANASTNNSASNANAVSNANEALSDTGNSANIMAATGN